MGLSSISLILSFDIISSFFSYSKIFFKYFIPCNGFLLKSVIAFFSYLFLEHSANRSHYRGASFFSKYFLTSILTIDYNPFVAISYFLEYWLSRFSILPSIFGWKNLASYRLKIVKKVGSCLSTSIKNWMYVNWSLDIGRSSMIVMIYRYSVLK